MAGATEWEKYKFELTPLRRDGGAAGELDTVRHVVHVPIARRIAEDGTIKAGLIYDESRLNQSRISVAWVSANTWGPGSIYGTVEFQFSWNDIIKNQKIYWVEAIAKYNPHAYRFLLSRDEIKDPNVHPYNPARDNGPLRFAGGKWYWNGLFTSEFMIADDLSLARATGLNFVMHHESICRTSAFCADMHRRPSTQATGGRLLAYVLAHDIRCLDPHLKPSKDDPNDRFDILDTAFFGLALHVRRAETGGPIADAAACENVVRGALALYGMDQVESSIALLNSIQSKQLASDALVSIVRKHFNAPAWQPET